MRLVLFGLIELFGIALFSAALGRRLLRLLRVPIRNAAERGIFAAALGIGAWQAVPFGLFALRVGSPGVIRIVTGILALLLLPDALAVLRGGGRWLRHARLPQTGDRVFAAALLLLLSALLVHALCPVVDGDAVGYHLVIALRWLEAGQFVYIPTITPTNWPAGIEMTDALRLALNPNAALATTRWLCGVLTIAGIFLYARRLGDVRYGMVALCLLLLYDGASSLGFWHQMTLGMVDVGTAVFTTLAIFALHLSALEPEKSDSWNRLAIVLTGFAACTKLTGLWIVAALTLTRLLLALYRGDGRVSAIRQAGLFGLLAFCVVLPWFLKTWAVTGNPVYPIAYGIFGGIEWTPAGWGIYQRAHMIRNTPPGYPPTAAVLRTSHAVIAGIFFGIAALTLKRTRRSALAIPAGAAALFAAIEGIANYFLPRFLMPIIPVALLCIGVWVARSRERRIAPFAAAGFALLTVLFCFRRLNETLPEAWRVAAGSVPLDEYRARHIPDYPMARYVNSHLPPGTPLFIGTEDTEIAMYHAQAMWPDRWLQDSVHYAPAERLEADLQRLKVHYLVLKTAWPESCPRSHYCRQRSSEETPALVDLAARRGVKQTEIGEYAFYFLDWNRPAKEARAER